MNPFLAMLTGLVLALLIAAAFYKKMESCEEPKIYTHVCINGVSYLESKYSLTTMYNPDGLPEPCEGTND